MSPRLAPCSKLPWIIAPEDEKQNAVRSYPHRVLLFDRSWCLFDERVAVRAGADFDLLRPDFLDLGQGQGQDAVVEIGLRLVRLDAGRQRDRALERAEAALLQQVAFLFLLRLGLGLALDSQGVARDRDVELFGLEARYGCLDDELVRVLDNVQRELAHHALTHRAHKARLDEGMFE